ncbi:MAG: sigma-70 family RNA polymerase sigma factor [Oscillospiraceae bacterium]|nr:sigma-70 family RNA polymerase sigma factor [Oscillospiraceae bacterium]MBR0450622.1 sigma-70 family RNA polymerase sigma factor [Oscillospiraceae bacterium]
MEPMEQIYQKYASTVYRFLLSKCRDEDLAEELTQETFYQAIKSIDRFDGRSQLSTWLCAIAKNVLSSYIKKNRIHEPLEEADFTVEGQENAVLNSIAGVELMKKLHSLPEPYREVMYMRVFGDLSFKEIGDILGKTDTWARVIYYRGKERLSKEVKNDEYSSM